MVASRGNRLCTALALSGFALVGTGLGLFLGIIGPAQPAPGGILVVAGLVSVVAARGLPPVERLSPTVVAAVGLALVVGIILHGALTYAPFDGRRIALALVGVGMQIAAPFLDRRLRVKSRQVAVASIVASALALVGTPLAIWAMSGGF